MPKQKLELPFEHQIATSLLVTVVGLLFIGALLIPIFDTKFAIAINHAFIALLPDSFDPLKFTSGDPDIFQKGQLILANLPLLPVVVSYPISYLMVVMTINERPLAKTGLFIFGVYCGFYAIGFMASTLTAM